MVFERDSEGLRFAVVTSILGTVSSKRSLKDLTPAGALTGESSTNDELASGPSSSSSSWSLARFAHGREPTRRLLSLFGEGDTGSPRSRLRALKTADFSGGDFLTGEKGLNMANGGVGCTTRGLERMILVSRRGGVDGAATAALDSFL